MSIDPNKRKSFDAVAKIYNEVRASHLELLVKQPQSVVLFHAGVKR